MEKITGNEPAMPATSSEFDVFVGDHVVYHTGLTIRQQFAESAMRGILSNEEMRMKIIEDCKQGKNWDLTSCVAKEAVLQADALINELNKQPND